MIIKVTAEREYFFSDTIEPSERLVKINEMLNDVLVINDEPMTIEDYFRETRDTPFTKTRLNLEKIGSYLSKMPDQDGKHDKEVLSRNDELEMEKGVRWVTEDGKRVLKPSIYTHFTYLSKGTAIGLGVEDIDQM